MSHLESLFAQDTVARLGWMLVHFLWQAAAVALLLAILLRLLQRAGAHWRYAVACGALALTVALPLVTMQLVEIPGPAAEAGFPPETSVPAIVAPTPVTVEMVDELPPPAAMPPLEVVDLAVPASWQEELIAALEPALPYLVLGWLAGVFGLSAWHLGGWAQLQRLKRRMVHRAGASLHATLAELAAKLGVRRAVTLLESALVEVPTVVGWLRPVILLPASALTGLTPDQLQAILAHELAHVRRHDYFVNMLQTVVEILGFYHPAVWWVSHRIRVERENCCDDLAVRICGSSLQYARALTSMEEIRHRRTDLALAATGGSLMARIARLLGRPAVDDRRFTWLPGLVALLLVAGLVIPAALVLAAPQTSPALSSTTDGLNSEPRTMRTNVPGDPRQMPDKPAAHVTTRAQVEEDAQEQDETTILIDFVVAKALTGATLDPETLLLIGATLAAEDPQTASEIVGADPKQEMTLGEILRKYVGGRLLAPATAEALVELLRSHGYVEIQAKPSIMTRDNIQAQIQTTTEEHYQPALDPNSPLQHVELGTVVRATPHLPRPAGEHITLEIAVELKEWAPQAQPGDPPAVRTTEIASTVTTLNDRYFALLAEQNNGEDAQTQDPESVLVMFKPRIVEPARKPTDQAAGPAQQGEKQMRSVSLDVRVVVMEGPDLDLLGAEWGQPTVRSSDSPNAMLETELRIGYTPDRAFTDMLLATLNRLQEADRADIIAHPQLLAKEGCESRIEAVTEEWFLPPASAADKTSPTRRELEKIESGTTIAVTPHIDDANNIILGIAIELSESIPRDTGADLPIVTRRKVRNMVTIRDGGTVALAGLKESQAWRNESAREVTIFVTASLVPETSRIAGPSSQGTEIVLPIPPAGNINREGLSSEGESPARGSPPRQIADARREYVASDLMVRELSKKTAQIERDLIASQQSFADTHPTVTQKKAMLKAFQDKLEQRRTELAQEFNSGLAERPSQNGPGEQTGTRGEMDVSPQQIVAARQSHVNSDPAVRELTANMIAAQEDLLVLQRSFMPTHPAVVQKKTLVDAFGKAIEERRKELEQEFDRGFSERLSGRQTRRPDSQARAVATQSETTAAQNIATGESQTISDANQAASRAWTVMRQWNGPDLLMGLGPRLAQLLEPEYHNDAAWQPVSGGGRLAVQVDMDGPNRAEVTIGLFEDAKWSKAPVAVRRIAGAGTHVLAGLPAGRFQIGAIAGKYAHALGVQRQWPEPVEVRPGETATAEVLVSQAFRPAGGLDADGIIWDYLGHWDRQDDTTLLRGRVTGPDGKPIPFARVGVCEYQAAREGGIAVPSLGADVNGIYKFAGMKWPYTVGVSWHEPLPAAFGSRCQTRYLNRVFEGPQELDARFDRFPQGTARVTGRVVDEHGAPVTAFFLHVQIPADAPAVAEGGRPYTTYGYTLTFISEDGQFEAGGLPDGPATVKAAPFGTVPYEADRGEDIVLEAGRTTGVQLELAHVKFFYGRVLFEDGSPAVVTPAPWEGAKTLIRMCWTPRPGGRSYHDAGEVDNEGYFGFYLRDMELDGLESGERRLDIRIPRSEPGSYETVGQFPVGLLSQDKSQGGTVTVTRSPPRIVSTRAGTGSGADFVRNLQPRHVALVATLVRMSGNMMLDRETAVQVFNLIGQADSAARVPMGMDELRASSAGQVLQGLAERVPAESFRAAVQLLKSKGLLDVSAASHVLVQAGRPWEANVGSASDGMALTVLAEIQEPGQIVQMDVKAVLRLSESVPPPPGRTWARADPPVAVRSLGATGRLAIPSERQALLFLSGTGSDAAPPNETYCLIVQPTIIPPRTDTSAHDMRGQRLAFKDHDLLQALTDISIATGLKIAVDATVKPEPVTAELIGGPPLDMLRGFLEGTPYRVKQVGDTFLVYRPITVSFRGVDLRQALQDIAAPAGVAIIPAPDVQGKVSADVSEQPLENALEIILAGTPYVVKRTPHYYLVAKGRAPGPDPNEEEMPVQVCARFLTVDEQLLKDLRRQWPIRGVTSAQDTDTLHALGRRLSEDNRLPLDSNEVDLLIRAVQSYGGKGLAAPKVTVLAGESAALSLTDDVPYTAGHDEPAGTVGEPVARQDSVRVGMQMEVMPELGPGDGVSLSGVITTTRLLGFDERMYQGKYAYQVPQADRIEVPLDGVPVPARQTLLLAGPTPGESWSVENPSETESPRNLLILLTADIVPAY